MAFGFKFPRPGAGKRARNTAPPPAGKASRLGAVVTLSVAQQLKVLGTIFVVLLLLITGLVYHDNRESTENTAYIAAAGEMRMLSQRLAKASSLARLGNQTAFSQLKTARYSFAFLLDHMRFGGELIGVTVGPSPTMLGPQLEALQQSWEATQKNVLALIGQETTLVALGRNVALIDSKNASLLQLAEQLASHKLAAGAPARDIAATTQLVMLTQRIARNATALLIGSEVNPEFAFQLGKDVNTFSELMQGLLNANNDSASREKLGELEAAFKDYEVATGGILGNLQPLVQAKQSAARILAESEELLKTSEALASGYQAHLSDRGLYVFLLIAMTIGAVLTLGMLAKVYLDDAARRAREAEQMRQASEQANRDNQEAILRLMNELGDLADGDLTVTATVSENITGAIADSINYTIEELRVLVGRINDAASRVTTATEIARQTSVELIGAAQRQSSEIREAGQSALDMARSMSGVSGEATQSAQVARQSLMAAEKGALAVQDSIKGMNEIRNQIQETSKRIKRLGESSQEIGEIVELISDITEQTNVLALNAAIQAASAGDAGRGFTVVAEEVQRLAERSAEATKQIAAIVKTIQTDTQDAVSAMEQSTQGVVEGAKLSDAAGQALAEIGQVSRNLADLIQNISSATQNQADSATHVADLMQDILHVTEQTTAGTQRTAEAVDELSALASELKGSVSGFRVD